MKSVLKITESILNLCFRQIHFAVQLIWFAMIKVQIYTVYVRQIFFMQINVHIILLQNKYYIGYFFFILVSHSDDLNIIIFLCRGPS